MTTPVAAPAATLAPQPGCIHIPPCPPAGAPDHDAAHVVSHDYSIGVSRLCNGVLLWDDTGETLPDRTTVAPHRPEPPHHKES